jgi:hypothetical protein
VHVAHEAELRHGYTLAHLNELAVRAVRVQRYNRNVDFTVRLELAWSAMAESLYAADEPPAPDDLIRAAWAAISDDTDRTYRASGIEVAARIPDVISSATSAGRPSATRHAARRQTGTTPKRAPGLASVRATDLQRPGARTRRVSTISTPQPRRRSIRFDVTCHGHRPVIARC